MKNVLRDRVGKLVKTEHMGVIADSIGEWLEDKDGCSEFSYEVFFEREAVGKFSDTCKAIADIFNELIANLREDEEVSHEDILLLEMVKTSLLLFVEKVNAGEKGE